MMAMNMNGMVQVGLMLEKSVEAAEYLLDIQKLNILKAVVHSILTLMLILILRILKLDIQLLVTNSCLDIPTKGRLMALGLEQNKVRFFSGVLMIIWQIYHLI
jgi:hypothetical protein